MHDIPVIMKNENRSIYVLGDNAITVDFGNSISESLNKKVLQLFASLQKNPMPGMLEAVPAYSSLTIYYDIFLLHKVAGVLTVQQWIIRELEKRLATVQTEEDVVTEDTITIDIPVCYEQSFAPDTKIVCDDKKLSPAALISLHTARIYQVYMTGFLPGFAYMGETDKQLHISRKEKPVPVIKGSVGLAGKQTGIYPLNSPGGWQIIGRTPLALFDASRQIPVLLKPGDRIQFYSISSHEFANY